MKLYSVGFDNLSIEEQKLLHRMLFISPRSHTGHLGQRRGVRKVASHVAMGDTSTARQRQRRGF
jgi:hypothetical protein